MNKPLSPDELAQWRSARAANPIIDRVLAFAKDRVTVRFRPGKVGNTNESVALDGAYTQGGQDVVDFLFEPESEKAILPDADFTDMSQH